MLLPTVDEPAYWILGISVGLLGLVIALLVTYWVIRLAATHGMLSYSRQLSEDHAPLRPHRN